jgi:hypothetical protein
MKIWNSYGSEHSANLVMIGRFRDVASAKEAKAIIDELTHFMMSTDDDFEQSDSFSDAALDLLKKLKFYSIRANELAQFAYDVRSEVKENQIVITTDELAVSAFFKLLIDKGARVEVYSAHDYPDIDKGR